ncbi:MAG: ABC transporter ATP-binding protein [Candidatus Zixiibacteriota bacterium]
MSEIKYAIDTRELKKNYGNFTALDSLDLKVKKNSIYGFIGPNGAGKTTTIKLLLGLLNPTEGKGDILGYNIKSQSVEIRKKTGYLTQSPSYYPKMTARETLRFCAGFYFSGPKNRIESKIDELLEMVELQDKSNRPVRGFSGGEIQRLGIAQALIHSPELLILDEPAASLDPIGRHKVLDTLEKLRGLTTVFYSTHILSDVERVSDTVGVLHQGKLLAQAPITEILSSTEDAVFKIELEKTSHNKFEKIKSFEWVKELKIKDFGDNVLLLITVTDSTLADKYLLRKLLEDETLTIKKYEKTSFNLESSFMELIKKSTVQGGPGAKQ